MHTPGVTASDDTMAELYDLAETYRSAAPWEALGDSQPFCVSTEPDAPSVPCTVLGAAGEVLGIAMYPGDEGRRTFELFRTGDMRAVEDATRYVRTASLTFCDRGALHPDSLKQIKRLGRTYRGAGAWPSFLSCLPGYLPWLLTEEDAGWLRLAMRGAIALAQPTVRGVPAAAFDDTQVPHLTLHASGGIDVEVRPLAPPPPPRALPAPAADPRVVQAIQSQCPPSANVWEIGAFPSEMVVAERGNRPYMATALAIIDHAQGAIVHVGLLDPIQWPAGALDALLERMATLKGMPAEVRTEDAELAAHLGPTLKALAIRSKRAKCPELRGFSEAYRKHFARQA